MPTNAEVPHATAAVAGPGAAESNAAPSRLALSIEITDPEVMAELLRRAEGEERARFALAALRLGVLSLRLAGGHLDQVAIHEAGKKLLADMGGLLSTRASELVSSLGSALQRYFDPGSGVLPTRLAALVQRDGELERLLRAYLGPEESVLARTLVTQLGEGSAIFRMLSPTDQNGLRSQLEKTLVDALTRQREQVLREFSLDHADSALSRLVGRITDAQGQLKQDLKGQVDTVVKEFSLDNDQSALSRLSRLLKETSEQIGRNLTLDDEQSALSRIKKSLEEALQRLASSNAEFHAEVRSTLAALNTRKEEQARSTHHGDRFEVQLGALLATEAQRVGDVHEATGLITGVTKNCKKGDYVIQLGVESAAPGARIAWEAKEDRDCDLKAALAEMEEARKNRQAQIGVFVFSRKTVPVDVQPFGRQGSDIWIVWDAEDSASDLFVRAAYSVARALAIREGQTSSQAMEVIQEIDRATRAVEKQIQYIDEIRTWADTVTKGGDKIKDRSERMKVDLAKEVERLDAQVAALRTSAPPA